MPESLIEPDCPACLIKFQALGDRVENDLLLLCAAADHLSYVVLLLLLQLVQMGQWYMVTPLELGILALQSLLVLYATDSSALLPPHRQISANSVEPGRADQWVAKPNLCAAALWPHAWWEQVSLGFQVPCQTYPGALSNIET